MRSKLRLVTTAEFVRLKPVIVDYWLVEAEGFGFLLDDGKPVDPFFGKRLRSIRDSNLLRAVYRALSRGKFDRAVVLVDSASEAVLVGAVLEGVVKPFTCEVYTLDSLGEVRLVRPSVDFVKGNRLVRLLSGMSFHSNFVREVLCAEVHTHRGPSPGSDVLPAERVGEAAERSAVGS